MTAAVTMSVLVALSAVFGASAFLSFAWIIARAVINSEQIYDENTKPMYKPVSIFVVTFFICVLFGMLADTLT